MLTSSVLFQVVESGNEHFKNFDSFVNFYFIYLDPFTTSLLTLSFIPFDQDLLLSAFKILYGIDKQFLKCLNTKINLFWLQILMYLCVFGMVSAVILWMTFLKLQGISLINQAADRICHLYCTYLMCSIMTAHIGFLLLAGRRFWTLNKHIERSLGYDRQLSEVLNELNAIENIHAGVCQALEVITKASSVQLMCLVFKCHAVMLGVLLSLYGMLPGLQGEMFYWVFLYWSMYFSDVVLCQIITEEVGANIYREFRIIKCAFAVNINVLVPSDICADETCAYLRRVQ